MLFENKLTLPVLIISATLLLMIAFQTRQLRMENALVKNAVSQQTQPLDQSIKVTQQFESLAVGTAKLADEGNATAKTIVGDFTKLGLKINTNAPAGKSPIERIQPPAAPAAQMTTPTAPATAPAAPAVGN